MFHYVNSITNTRGDALTGFFVKAVNTTTGSVVSIYADASSTPIISVSGVANAAEVDDDGNASFYVDSGTYHLDIYATDGITFVRRIANIPMQTAADFLTAATLAASTGAARVGKAGSGTVQDAVSRIGTFVGYDTGVGGTVTQSTSKATTVTINKVCGQITSHNASLAAGATAIFVLNNSNIASTDLVLVNLQAAGAGAHNIGDYTIRAGQPGAGNCAIAITNNTAGALAEVIIINFVVIKAVAA